MTYHSSNRKLSQLGFTLLELLTVLAILSAITLLTLPAFNGLTRCGKLDAAAEAVHAAAKLARQHALTHRQPVFLVFHDDETADQPFAAFRSYALFTIDLRSSPVTQASGLFLRDWQPLPEGIVFDADAFGRDNLFHIGGGNWEGGFSKRNNLLHIDRKNYIVLGFKPDGQSSRYNKWLFLTEGFYTADGRLQRTGDRCKEIRIDRQTGKSSIVDLIYADDGNPRELES